MDWIHWFGFLGITLIAISLIIDAIKRTNTKDSKRRFIGLLQLGAIIFGVMGFFLMSTHFIENMVLINGLLICMIILYSLSFVARFLMRNRKEY